MRANIGRIALALLLIAAGAVGTSSAQEPVSFEGKTVTILIGHAAGGGTDRFGRVLGQHLSKELPGNPGVIVQNQPGADGMVALNGFAMRAKPDGLTLTVGSQAQVDPVNYRRKTVTYKPTDFEYVGGASRAGTAVIISKSAIDRINNKNAAAVTVGALAAVRSGMQVVLWGGEYLNWNIKWVLGYPRTNDLNFALERGEVDMTSIPVIDDALRLLATGRFATLVQSGALHGNKLVPVPAFGDAPTISDLLDGKVDSPIAQDAFTYWGLNASVGQWAALPKGTPAPIVRAYREAFNRAMTMPDMRQTTQLLNGDLLVANGEEMAEIVGTLAKTSPEALQHIIAMGARQGLSLGN